MSKKEENAPIITRAKFHLENAEKVLFLGFGYHDTNLRRLGIASLSDKNKMVGTSVGLGQADWRSISDTWHITFKGSDVDIMSLFHNYVPL